MNPRAPWADFRANSSLPKAGDGIFTWASARKKLIHSGRRWERIAWCMKRMKPASMAKNTNHKSQITNHKIQITKYKIQNTKYKVQDRRWRFFKAFRIHLVFCD